MRAVKIDPVSRTVTEINLKKNPNSTLEELYSIIGCDLVELVQIDRDMVMVVNESVFAQGYAPTREGKGKNVQGAFTFIGWGRSLPEQPSSSVAVENASKICRRTSYPLK